jgi:hypothetical protein
MYSTGRSAVGTIVASVTTRESSADPSAPFKRPSLVRRK